MQNWKTVREELLKDPEVRKEYERLKPRYELISQLISARAKKGFTQAQLAKKWVPNNLLLLELREVMLTPLLHSWKN